MYRLQKEIYENTDILIIFSIFGASTGIIEPLFNSELIIVHRMWTLQNYLLFLFLELDTVLELNSRENR